jgi:hypothetical protein
MKLRVVFAVASISAVSAALPACADEHGKRGDYRGLSVATAVASGKANQSGAAVMKHFLVA